MATKTNGIGASKVPKTTAFPNRICRDYAQGQCHRNFCRYPHVTSADQVVFCHDFQNTACPRIHCKFLHVSIETEEYYRKYGRFPDVAVEAPNEYDGCPNSPPHPKYQSIYYAGNHYDPSENTSDWPNEKNQPPPHFHSQPQQPPPAQHDYGHRRTAPTSSAQQQQLQHHRQQQYQQIQQHQHIQQQHLLDSAYSAPPPPPPPTDITALPPRKRINEHLSNGNSSTVGQDDLHLPPNAKRFLETTINDPPVLSSDVMAILRRFEEEHNKLRTRVEAAELKIEELRATNDYLLNQNTQFRLTNAAAAAAAAAVQRGMTTATVTTVSQPQATMLNAVSIAPVQLQTATPIVSMAGPQIIASTSCGTPLSISANTTQGQQIAALAQQSLNTLSTTAHQAALNASAQILGASQITLTPGMPNAPSIELTLNTSQALACVSNATQPIISYPVMTHSILPH